MILWFWCVLVQEIIQWSSYMSDQSTAYKSLTEAIRREYEDILELE